MPLISPYKKNKKLSRVRKGLAAMRSARSSGNTDPLSGIRMRGAESVRSSIKRKKQRRAKNYALNRMTRS